MTRNLDENIEPSLHKISILRDSQLFVGLTEEFKMAEKQSILLVFVGYKQVGEATSGHWVLTDNGRAAAADDESAVRSLLDELGLHYVLRSDVYGVTALVSMTEQPLQRIANASDDQTIGELYGFPETAAHAFAGDELVSPEKQALIEARAGLEHLSLFRFSRQHWRDELQTALDWKSAIEKYDFT